LGQHFLFLKDNNNRKGNNDRKSKNNVRLCVRELSKKLFINDCTHIISHILMTNEKTINLINKLTRQLLI